MGKLKFKTRCFLDIKIGDESVGRIVVELFDDLCPKATDNFKKLCQGICGLGLKTGKPLHYQGSCFHRVIKGFMIQGGDFSKGDGTGGESTFGGTFADENLETPHDRPFLLSMANRGPNTNGSQFFITTAAAPHLNKKHVVFGHVFSGFDVVAKIEDVAIADTRTHRPLKSVIIENCGELIPVKKGKSKKEEKELKKKRRKEKKHAHKSKRHPKSSETEDDSGSCKIRPEEIPDVPLNKFLYRNVSRPSNTSDGNPYSPPLETNNTILQTKKTIDRSGRITKGRGTRCYERETTPPHWRKAIQRMRKLNPEDSRKWHDSRHNRKPSRERRFSPDEESCRSRRNDSVEYPIRSRRVPERNESSPSVARNRSPSPPTIDANKAIADVIYRNKNNSPVSKRSRKSSSHSHSDKRRRILLLEETTIASRSPSRDNGRHRDWLPSSPVPNRQNLVLDHHSSYSEDSDVHGKSPQPMIRQQNSNLAGKRRVIETGDGYVVNVPAKVDRNNSSPLAKGTSVTTNKWSSSKRKGSVTHESPVSHRESRSSRRGNDSPRKESVKMPSSLEMDQSPIRRKFRQSPKMSKSPLSQRISPQPPSKSISSEVPRHEPSKERRRHPSSPCSSSSSNDSRHRPSVVRGRRRSPSEDSVRPRSQVTHRSPPQHLVDKWRERKERRSGPRASLPQHPNSRGRRRPSSSRSASSASRSASRSPARRNHARRDPQTHHPASSSTHSRSPSKQKDVVGYTSTELTGKSQSSSIPAEMMIVKRPSPQTSNTDRYEPTTRESRSMPSTAAISEPGKETLPVPLLSTIPVESISLPQNGDSDLSSKSLIDVPLRKVEDSSTSRWDTSPPINDLKEIPVPPTKDEMPLPSLPVAIKETTHTQTNSDVRQIEEKNETKKQDADGTWTTSRWRTDDLTNITLPPNTPPSQILSTSDIRMTVAALSSNTSAPSAVAMEMSDSDASSPPHASTSVLARLRAAEQQQKSSVESLSKKEEPLNLEVAPEEDKTEKVKTDLTTKLPPSSIGVQLRKTLESTVTGVGAAKKNGNVTPSSKDISSKSDQRNVRKPRKTSSASYTQSSVSSTSSSRSDTDSSDSSDSSYSDTSHSSHSRHRHDRRRSSSRRRHRCSSASSSSSIDRRRRSRRTHRGSGSFHRRSRYSGSPAGTSWSSNRRVGTGGGRSSRRGGRGRSSSRSNYDGKHGFRRRRSSSRSS